MRAFLYNPVGLLAVILLCPVVGCAQNHFPEWRARQATLYGVWEAAPVVLVGDLVNICEYGIQNVKSLPYPVTQDIHRLYWCQGDFRVNAVIKGSLKQNRKKYLFASVNPGCELHYGDDARASAGARDGFRAWFVREEGEFLRPPYDGGAALYIGFRVKWNEGPVMTPLERFGTLLLTPGAAVPAGRDFERMIWEHADIGCAALGKTRCVSQLRGLARHGGANLRTAVCEYLRAQQGSECDH